MCCTRLDPRIGVAALPCALCCRAYAGTQHVPTAAKPSLQNLMPVALPKAHTSHLLLLLLPLHFFLTCLCTNGVRVEDTKNGSFNRAGRRPAEGAAQGCKGVWVGRRARVGRNAPRGLWQQ